MSVSNYFLWFLFFSLLGWVYECIFCTVKGGHWENRGFLFGPICPIYGCGGVLVLLVFGNLTPSDVSLPLWAVFLISLVGSAIMEYITSYVLEKLFHAIWWDYSNVPLNINGRICLPASIGFGVVGTVLYQFVLPLVNKVTINIPSPVSEPLALLLMAFFGADIALTVSTLTSLVATIERFEEEVNVRAEEAYQAMLEKKDALLEKKDALSEKATALLEKKDALSEKATALLEKKDALSEKAAAFFERNNDSAEKDSILQDKMETSIGKREALLEKKELLAERGKAYEQQLAESIRKFTLSASSREKHTLQKITAFRGKQSENQFAKRLLHSLHRRKDS